ncbi:hypothetical protein R3B00_001295 [Klebsiella pneumoniae]|nr:hypothetical protein [Klebsiella pneumoniae]ELQ8980633.1 hypothetical protein [Klebsiella pneumoniae]
MANAFDNLNYGIGTHILDTQSQYNTNQQNELGQSLATTTPSGSIPASDPNNDEMTDFERKAAAQRAKRDTLAAHDTEGKYIFQDGTVMDKTPSTRKSVAISGTLSFAAGYFSHMGDQDEAIAAGTQNAGLTISAHEDRIKRENLLPSLESQTDQFGNPLYNPVDMMKYIETGDSNDLVKNQGKWLSDGQGWMHNSLTGQSRQITGYQTKTPKLTQVDLGDRVSFVDEQGNEVHSFDKEQTPDQAAKSGANDSLDTDNSGDDGTGTETNHGYTFQNGQYVKPKYNSKGKQVGWDVAGPQLTKQLNAGKAADIPDASQTRMSNDLDILEKAQNEGKTGSFTGYSTYFMPKQAEDFNSARAGGDERTAYKAYQRVQGYMLTQGVGDAKNMGASGINTKEEAQMYFAKMPSLDPMNMDESIQQIRDYTNAWNSKHKIEATGKTSDNSVNTGKKDFSHMW